MWATCCHDITNDAILSPKVGSQQYDAMVEDPYSEPTSYLIEITQAHMGTSEHYRMIHLENEGWAPGPLSRMTRIGGKKSQNIQPGRVLNSTDGYIQSTVDLVTEAIDKKLKKNYKQPIFLLVSFHDFILKDNDRIYSVFKRSVSDVLKSSSNPFERIYLIGSSGSLILRVDR
jgi:hypothetical protein